MRKFNRNKSSLREISIETDISAHAEGSCLIKFGDTHILCTATLDESVPNFLKNRGSGWVTAEYGMLPRSTHQRMRREAATGKQTGRTMEIQRLIARSLRSVVDLKTFGERQIIVDCDVLQADGGTRTASITGGFVAMHLAMKRLMENGIIPKNPIITEVAAVSCGIVDGQARLDLDYEEDSSAEVDANFVMTGNGGIVEIQATAEETSFSEDQLAQMQSLAKLGIKELVALQRKILKIPSFDFE